MESLATYSFYSEVYCNGRKQIIDSPDLFDNYAKRATKTINGYIGHSYEINSTNEEELEMCCCELVELRYKLDVNSQTANVSSEKTGSYSVSYASENSRLKDYSNRTTNAIKTWLLDTGLLYKGLS